ncbi:MAG TPA: circadian clock protein KaiC [Candidatus Eisenbacteria bacterium]|nr:circadian clock protein KaiC [Candidatus Eisenbacteria bacterium]
MASKASSHLNSNICILPKAPTGIPGLDEITQGGLPRGRPTLVCGSAGCGKTLFAMEFLIRGATEFGEPGVFMAFEESAEELTQNVRSLGFDLDKLVRQKKMAIDFVRVERNEIEETGDYDLEGLFIRLNAAIDSIGAKRVVLDTIEALFSGLQNEGILRAELRRLFRWLKDKGVTAVITGERGDGTLTRRGLEEYVSDCVILLDHRVNDQISTRRMRIVKYRGTTHGTNEYPFLIDEDGFSVLPITSLGLQHDVSNERISSGVERLDNMLGGKGFYRGTTILISGTAGTGKTSMAAHFVKAACERGERALYFAFEESPGQLMRNMRSIGINLSSYAKKELLQIHSSRATFYGLEMHLAMIHKMVQQANPDVVVFDPIGALIQAGTRNDAHAMIVRLIDFLKFRQITAMLLNLTTSGEALEHTDVDISSIVDSWLLLRDVELGGERNRALYVLKSRGMAHSNQLREFLLTARGIDLLDVYVGPEGVLTGSSRVSLEARERAATLAGQQEAERKERDRERKREALEAKIIALRKEFEIEEAESELVTEQETTRRERLQEDRQTMARSRHADEGNGAARPRIRQDSR